MSPERTLSLTTLILMVLPLTGCGDLTASKAKEGPIQVVVVTGGHDFEEAPFREMFASFDEAAITYAPQKDDSEILDDVSQWNYDVILLYNMSQKITPARQKNLQRLVDKGVGVVAVHHALAAFQDWDGFAQIVGGKFFLADRSFKGTAYKQSTYQHDEQIRVRVADPRHPVTQGLQDFMIQDETYKGYRVEPDSHVLLETDHPLSERAIAWAQSCGKGRVVYVELGHDGHAYGNPSYRRFLRQAIAWSAQRKPS